MDTFITTILTSTVVSTIFLTLSNIFIDQRKRYAEYITNERAKWRNDIRKISSEIMEADETNLFKLLFLQKLNGLNSFNDIYEWMGDKQATVQLSKKLELPEDKVKKIYIMLIIFTHGVATMIATGGATIADVESAEILEKAYKAFIKLQK